MVLKSCAPHNMLIISVLVCHFIWIEGDVRIEQEYESPFQRRTLAIEAFEATQGAPAVHDAAGVWF